MNIESLISSLKELESNALNKLDAFNKARITHGAQFYEGYLTALLHIRAKLNEQKDSKEVSDLPKKPIC